jgi:hypothetical protein
MNEELFTSIFDDYKSFLSFIRQHPEMKSTDPFRILIKNEKIYYSTIAECIDAHEEG